GRDRPGADRPLPAGPGARRGGAAARLAPVGQAQQHPAGRAGAQLPAVAAAELLRPAADAPAATGEPGAVVPAPERHAGAPAGGAVRAGVYLDMQERTATKRLFDDLYAERLGIETAVGRILAWERLDDRRASRIVDYREIRDLANLEERQAAADWAAETVVRLMDALDNRLRQTAQVLLSRVQ